MIDMYKKFAKCPRCGKEVEVDTSVVLTSNPPMYNLDCPNCGRQYIPCNNCYEASRDNNVIERDVFKRIEELEKHQKEQDELLEYLDSVVKMLTDGTI